MPALLAAVVGLWLPGIAAAASVPVALGDPLTLFAPQPGTLDYPVDVKIAQAGDGSAVAVWVTKNFAAPATTARVYFRRIAADGTLSDTSVPVDSDLLQGDVQISPSVAADAAGNFVVTWIEESANGYPVYPKARLFAADGTPRTAAFDAPQGPALMDDAGNFAIVAGTVVSRYAADGSLQATEPLDLTTDSSATRAYAMNRQTDALAVATVSVQYGNAGSPLAGTAVSSVQLDPFDAGGNRLAQTAIADQCTEYSIIGRSFGCRVESPRVAIDDSGHTVVAWVKDNGSIGQVYALSYSDDNTPQSGKITPSSRLNKPFGDDSLAAGGNAGFVIAGQGYDAQAGPGAFGRSFDFDGKMNGRTFTVSATPITDGPVIAADAAGDMIAIWDVQASGDQSRIFAQRYRLP